MSLTIDTTTDFLVVDNLELVTFRLASSAEPVTFTNTTGVRALGSHEEHGYIDGMSVIAKEWTLYGADLPNVIIEKRCRVKDAANAEWIIENATWDVWQTVWHVTGWRKRDGTSS